MVEPATTREVPQESVQRRSVVGFLAALVAFIIAVPFLEQLPNSRMIETALLTIVLLSAVLAVGGRRRTLEAAILLVSPAILATWVGHLRPDLLAREIAAMRTKS